ncbi:MAG: diaminopimelate decarboxylase [Clostridiales bacterium]|jgi:diaminopimelate decarboxylase|nr:diaminopimelate decarboxylase [Clostridiales bacterium]
MMISDCFAINDQGHLTIGGCDTVALAKEFGTPLYVMDEDKIRRNCRMYQDSIQQYYQGRGLVLYASKAFNCKEMCRIVNEEGLGLDVVSGGELYTALQAGFPAGRIHFHGNNKTREELSMALDAQVGHFIVDNLRELELLDALAKEKGQVADISLRIKPGIDAHTHEAVMTGQIDSKFGFALETGEALEAVRFAAQFQHVNLKGLHNHIGSQIFDIAPFLQAARVMLNFIAQIKKEVGIVIEELNLGGGFGIKYVDQDRPVPYGDYMKEISLAVVETCKELSLEVPYIYMEPGRSIVGEAGLTLYEVGGVKEIPGVRTYVSIDGGMTDNPRYALYQSDYTVMVANKANEPADQVVTVAGKCCESGDLIQEHTPIQSVEAGDLLTVLCTGAYNFSMASNYNRIPRPAVVMVKNGIPRVVVRRETYEDLIRNDQ